MANYIILPSDAELDTLEHVVLPIFDDELKDLERNRPSDKLMIDKTAAYVLIITKNLLFQRWDKSQVQIPRIAQEANLSRTIIQKYRNNVLRILSQVHAYTGDINDKRNYCRILVLKYITSVKRGTRSKPKLRSPNYSGVPDNWPSYQEFYDFLQCGDFIGRERFMELLPRWILAEMAEQRPLFERGEEMRGCGSLPETSMEYETEYFSGLGGKKQLHIPPSYQMGITRKIESHIGALSEGHKWRGPTDFFSRSKHGTIK